MSIKVNIQSLTIKNKVILNNINFECANNTITTIIGRNGSGKSTLVNVLASNIKYDGKIYIDNNDINKLNSKDKAKLISFVFQNINTPHIKVNELVSFGRTPYTDINNKLSENDVNIINKAISCSNINDIENCYLDQISGGEIKKAYFAMMLAQNTNNVVLDEVTSSMDKDNERNFLSLIRKITNEENKCTICVMHNIDNAIRFSDNILLLDNGKQIFYGKTEDLLKTNLIEQYLKIEKFVIDNEIFYK